MGNYHYTECGLSDVYLNNGFVLEQGDGENYIGIEDIDDLHRLLGKALTEKTSALIGEQARFLRIEIGLSQKALALMLGVDAQTVARWEKDHNGIPRTTDVTLRALYLESINRESHIGLLLKMLSESEEKRVVGNMTLENKNNHWQLAV